MKREEGISLIEILAAIVLTSIVAILLYSIVTNSTKSYDQQINANNEVNDAAFALKVITKELRKKDSVTLVGPNCLFASETKPPNETTLFCLDGTTLKQDGKPLVDHIQSFNVTNSTAGVVTIKIVTGAGRISATEIVLRKGDT